MVQEEHLTGKAPLSAHPAFPPIVGLWFAALFGLGTVVLPAVVIETFASVTRLAAVVPMLDAPLDGAGRAVFALLAAVIGLVGGLVLARRVARAQDGYRPVRRRTPAGRAAPPRPLSVHDELGEDAIAPPTDMSPTIVSGRSPTRRRALTLSDEPMPNDTMAGEAAPSDHFAAAQEPVAAEAPEPDFGTLPTAQAVLPTATEESPSEDFAMPAYVPELDTRKPRAVTAPSTPEQVLPEPVWEAEDGPIAPFTAPITPAPIDRPLEDLGMVQLAERLGRSLQHRLAVREAEALREPEAIASPPPLPEHGEPAIAVPPPVVPDALRAFMDVVPEEPTAAAPIPFAIPPFDPEDDEDGEEHLALGENYSSLLEMSSPFRQREEFVRIDEPEPADDEIAPAVVFPAQEQPIAEAREQSPEDGATPGFNPGRPFDAPQLMPAPPAGSPAPRPAMRDAAETERALRAALANLQRMSGAA